MIHEETEVSQIYYESGNVTYQTTCEDESVQSQPLNSCSSDADYRKINNSLSKLQLAYRYLTPVLDEILSTATGYSQEEFKCLLASKRPICTISIHQYTKAQRASEIIKEVGVDLELAQTYSNLPVTDIIVNRVNQTTRQQQKSLINTINEMADRIYIDRDLMKQLVDLHEMITNTIKRLKKNINNDDIEPSKEDESDDMPPIESDLEAAPRTVIDKVKHDLEQQFIIIDANQLRETNIIGNEVKKKRHDKTDRRRKIKDYRMEQPRIKLLTVDVLEPAMNSDNYPKHYKYDSECTDSCADDSFCLRNRKQKDKEQKTENDISQQEELTSASMKIDNKTAGGGDKKVKDEEVQQDVEEPPETNKEVRYDTELTQTDVISMYDKSMKTSEPFFVLPQSSVEKIECKAQTDPNGSCDVEMMRLREIFAELVKAINLVKKQSSPEESVKETKCRNCSIPSCSVQTTNKTDSEKATSGSTQDQLLEYLKELDQIKQLMETLDNPELVVETVHSIRDTQKPCCFLSNTPHVHAKLNGISIIIKVNQQTIDNFEQNEPNSNEKTECENCAQTTMSDRFETKAIGTCNCNKPEDANERVGKVKKPFSPRQTNVYVQSTRGFTVNDTPNHEYDVLEYGESQTYLPYTCAKRSLPNVDICAPMEVEPRELIQNMQTTMLKHPNNDIQTRLQAIGLENIIRASLPAKCCRRAVLNEIELEEEPLRASLNSLPLTRSDLEVISKFVGRDTYEKYGTEYECMKHYYQLIKSKLEYYTNFQENFASNFEYFIPIQRTFEVHFFTFKKEDQQKSSNNIPKPTRSRTFFGDLKIAEMFRKLIYNAPQESPCAQTPVAKERQSKTRNSNSNQNQQQSPSQINTPRTSKNEFQQNKRCQANLKRQPASETKEKCKVVVESKPPAEKKPRSPIVSREHKTAKVTPSNNQDQCVLCKMGNECDDCSSLSPKNFAATLSGIYQLDNNGKMRSKLLTPPIKSKESSAKSLANQSIFSGNASGNLGTIYETDEKTCLRDRMSNDRNYDTFYELLKSPDMSTSFHNIISSDIAVKAFNRSNPHVEPEQFWSAYIEAKKSSRSLDSSEKNVRSNESVVSFKKIPRPTSAHKLKTKLRRTRSRIPRRVRAYSDSSSDRSSSYAKPPLKCYENVTQTKLTVDSKPTMKRSSCPPPKKKDNVPQDKDNIHLSNKAKIFFTELLEETAKNQTQNDIKCNSLQSLQVLASKSGPGYICVLHPICGCPEVSIFIPCYCDEESHKRRSGLSAKKIEKLINNNDGRHIILPWSCRIEKNDDNNHAK